VPVSAGGPDTWGFYYRSPRSAPPGERIGAALSSQADWNMPFDEATSEVARDHLPRIMACSDDVSANLTMWLIDPDGRLVVRAEALFPIPRSPALLTVPEGTTPGPYSVRRSCIVDGELHAACIDYEVTAAGTAVTYEDPLERGVPLWSDACPSAPWIVAGDAARRVGVRLDGLRHLLDAFRGLVIPGPPLTVTTQIPQVTNPPVTPPNSPGPAPDTTPPSISGVGLKFISSSQNGCTFEVSATVTDNVGVQSVVYSGAANGSMSGGPTYSAQFSVGIFPNGFSITVTATDTSNLKSSAGTGATCPP
jgi:hypothetical protein